MKISVTVLLSVVILSTVFEPLAYASWWTRTRDKLTNAAVNYVAGAAIAAVGRKRGTYQSFLENGLSAEDCTDTGFTPDVKLDRDVASASFQKADANGDGVLQDDEAINYEALLLIINYCVNGETANKA